MNPPYYVYVSDRGSASGRQIAAVVAETLADLGYRTVFPVSGFARTGQRSDQSRHRATRILLLQGGHSERELLNAARVSVTVGVEQPDTARFDLGAHYASVGPMALDISRDGVDALGRRGIDAAHLQLGYHPSWDRWGGDPNRPRPTDLLFFGSMTAHRGSPSVRGGTAAVGLQRGDPPVGGLRTDRLRTEQQAGASAEASADMDALASSRVLLNIHSGQGQSLEWPLVLAAIINGCLVVTESSADYGPLLPGEHLIAAPSDVLGAYAASLVADEALRSDMTAAAYDFVRTKLEFKTLLEPVCALIEDAAASTTRFRRPQPIRAPARPSVPPRPPQLDAILDMERQMYARANGAAQWRERPPPAGRGAPGPPPPRQRWSRRDVRHASLGTCDARGQRGAHLVQRSRLHHRGHVVGHELTGDLAVELIVVDDHSEDGSVDAVKQLMASTEWFPTKLLARAANAGMGPARNIGIAEARADRVFISDAGTSIFPTTLQKLSAALDRSPDSAAAYGIIAGSGRAGLLSYLPLGRGAPDRARLPGGGGDDPPPGVGGHWRLRHAGQPPGLRGLRVLAAAGRQRIRVPNSCPNSSAVAGPSRRRAGRSMSRRRR